MLSLKETVTVMRVLFQHTSSIQVLKEDFIMHFCGIIISFTMCTFQNSE